MAKSNKAYIQRHKSYQSYANKEMAADRKPMKFKHYKVEPVYFKAMSKQTTESRLSQSGLSDEEINRFKRKKK